MEQWFFPKEFIWHLQKNFDEFINQKIKIYKGIGDENIIQIRNVDTNKYFFIDTILKIISMS